MKGEEELKAANEIQTVISGALSSMRDSHPKTFQDGRFANWTANVMMNIIIKLAQRLGEPKENIMAMFEEIWDGLEEMSKDEDMVLN